MNKPLIIALALAAAAPSAAFADPAADGPWTCAIRIHQTAKNITTGGRVKPQNLVIDDRIAAYPDGTYETINLAIPEFIGYGTWRSSGRKAVFFQTNLAEALQYGCALTGITCKPMSAFAKLVLKENMKRTKMTGTYTGRATMLANASIVKTNATGTVKCTPFR